MAGLPGARRYAVEGAAWLLGDLDGWLDDPERRQQIVMALRHAESEPTLLGVSAHMLTVARCPV